MNESLQIREATPADAAEVIRLFTQLGHPQPNENAESRLAAFYDAGDRVLVAENSQSVRERKLLGATTLHITPEIHRPGPIGRMTAVVVDEPARGRGIGRLLIEAAERYFVEHGCAMVEVTSNKKRLDAHRFYEQLGYTGTSFRFAKELPRTRQER
ncbi:MAG TPA: GNAT family N-acetyltransferase [Gemmatimonadaceae bacterium]|nr:GNAT family N-acetyltransferase [Gemmatimonadaceae bacterium]